MAVLAFELDSKGKLVVGFDWPGIEVEPIDVVQSLAGVDKLDPVAGFSSMASIRRPVDV